MHRCVGLCRPFLRILGFALGDVGSSLKVLGREETRCDVKCLFKCHFLCETLTALIRTPNLSLPGHFLFLFSDFYFLVKTYEHLSYMLYLENKYFLFSFSLLPPRILE